MIERFRFDTRSLVVEVASNDGYLLQYFRERGIPVLGIEPARNVARAAEGKGIPTLARFFGKALAGELAASGRQAELIVGNNVLAHIPDLDDFVGALQLLLKPGGVCTLEFPHLLRLIEGNQFDTIYHEHFSYFSFLAAEKIFDAHDLTLFDVEELPTHGGSLRVFGRHADDTSKPITPRVVEMRAKEEAAGLARIESYHSFSERVKETK